VNTGASQADVILNKALELGESAGWDALRLHSVADALHLSLDEIRTCYPQKDDLAEAWFDRADQGALAVSERDDFPALPERTRMSMVIMAWLDSLLPHRRLTRSMLGYKLEPGHIHLQALGIQRISRTVQWFMEAAQLDVQGLQRIVTESALTTTYLATFARWLLDDSPDSRETRRLLDAALSQQERLLATLFRQTADSKQADTPDSDDPAAPAIQGPGDH
jgi:AcrR family transcriptional regulator